MGGELVTVIIPVYNAQAYLERCVESVLDQSYQSIEVILVDDCSQDGSGELCRSCRERDSRVTYIRHERNKGVSGARNSALDIARGTFLLFVDADDYVGRDFVAVMAGLARQGDVGASGYGRGGRQFCLEENGSGRLERDEFLFHTFCSNRIGVYCVNKIFRRSLVGRLRFDETLTIGEDMAFVAAYLAVCKSFYYTPLCLYEYYVNEGSAMRKMYRDRRFEPGKMTILDSAARAGAILSPLAPYPSLCMSYREVRTCVWCIFQMILCRHYEPGTGKRLKRQARKHFSQYRQLRFGSPAQDGMALLLCLAPRLAYLAGRGLFLLFPGAADRYIDG